MAELSPKDVHDIADLARLELTAAEAEKMRVELSAILGYIEQLKECDVTGVEPMTHAVPMDCPLRDDAPAPSLTADEALSGAPRRAEGFFEVPKIIEGGN
jgi:aspartyl-tRNA(Asn)/glutamyl-tRNA(Gln) amidotransferase subunit C